MAEKLASEKVVVSSPLSFHGSAHRIWQITEQDNPWLKWLLFVPAALILIAFAWGFVLGWYCFWGIWLVPYRLIRRSDRKRKMESLRHRELLGAVNENKNK